MTVSGGLPGTISRISTTGVLAIASGAEIAVSTHKPGTQNVIPQSHGQLMTWHLHFLQFHTVSVLVWIYTDTRTFREILNN